MADAGNSDPKRTVGRPFPKGVSGNPSGRPKQIQAFHKALRERHYELALNALEKCLRDGDGRVRVAALREVFDRLFGKATTVLAGEDGGPIPVSVDFEAVLERLAKADK